MSSVNITAADQWSEAEAINGNFDVSVWNSASFVGTITLQRRRMGGSTNWRAIKTYTAVSEETGESAGNWEYRIGCAAGNYTSGTITAEVSG